MTPTPIAHRPPGRRPRDPALVALRRQVAARVQELARRRHGAGGVRALAREAGLPYESWRSYRAGGTMPAEVALRILVVTGASPRWLLTGEGEGAP